MFNQQLIEYIKKAQAGGMSDNAIKAALLGAGWPGQAVDEAFGGDEYISKFSGCSATRNLTFGAFVIGLGHLIL